MKDRRLRGHRGGNHRCAGSLRGRLRGRLVLARAFASALVGTFAGVLVRALAEDRREDRREERVEVEFGVEGIDFDRAGCGPHVMANLGRFLDHRGTVEIVGVDVFVGERQELRLVGRTVAQLGERQGGLAIAPHLLAHALGHRCENLFGHGRPGPRGLAPDLGQVPYVGAVLDLAQRASPVGVVRAELLLERREPVPQRRVADLALRDVADLSLDVGVQVRGRLLLDAQEVLFIQNLHAIDRSIERIEQLLDKLWLFGLLSPRLGRHVLGE
jgi:hypothetical protein